MHFLYVARGENGLVKIGLTSQPRRRGYALSREFRARGDKLVQIKVCPGAPFGFGIETHLRSQLRKQATTTTGREWFTGLCFDETYARVCKRVMELRQSQLFGRYAA